MQYVEGIQTRFGQGGNLGGLPREYVARKYESTCLYEPQDLLYEFQRNVLRDNTPEAPTLESDMPRYDHGSRNLMNVQYGGSRSKVRPDHPEIFIGNTTRDERGANTKPNMALYKKGLEYRMKYKDLKSDATSDQTVAAPVWSTPAINAAKRSTWADLKRRMRWFERSLSAKYNGTRKMMSQTSRLDMIHRDDNSKIRTLSDVPMPLYTPGAMVLGGPNKVIGRRRVPSHRFKVAAFGRAPASHAHYVDPQSNFDKTVISTAFDNSEEGMHHALASIMAGEQSRVDNGVTTADMMHSTEPFTTGGAKGGSAPDPRGHADHATQTQEMIEAVIVEANHSRAKVQNVDGNSKRVHKWFDPDIYQEVIVASHIAPKLIQDPFLDARRKRMTMTEIDVAPSLMSQFHSTTQKLDPQRIAAARDNGWVEFDAGSSKMVYRGAAGPHTKASVSNVEAAAYTNEVEFTNSAVKDRLIGPMGTKSAIRRHVRIEPIRGPAADVMSRG